MGGRGRESGGEGEGGGGKGGESDSEYTLYRAHSHQYLKGQRVRERESRENFGIFWPVFYGKISLEQLRISNVPPPPPHLADGMRQS